MRSMFIRALLLALVALAAYPVIAEAILVAPHAVFIDHRSRTGQITLINNGTAPEEVDIAPRFGYPVTDSLGNISVPLYDTIPAGAHAATDWIRAFPRRVVVPPGGRQLVRLLATPPTDLADGEYWTRLVVTSRGQQVTLDSPDSTIRAGLTLEVRTIIAVTFRNGDVSTSVRITDLSAEATSDSLIVWLGVDRGGNAAYLGTAELRLVDANNRTVDTWSQQLAVYEPLRRRLAYPLDAPVAAGSVVRVRITTAREDLPSSVILPAAPADASVAVVRP